MYQSTKKRTRYDPAYPTMGYSATGRSRKAPGKRTRAIAPYVAKLTSRELKFIDTVPSADPVIASDTFSAGTVLNTCIAGPLATNRIGRKIKMENLFIRWGNTLAATSVGGSPLRILIVYDRQTNIALPAITSILLTDSFYSPMNLSNRDRYLILMDKITAPIAVNGQFSVSGKKFINLRGLEAMYNTTEGGSVADITTGGIYLFVAQNSGITVATPNFFSTCRIKFSDL